MRTPSATLLILGLTAGALFACGPERPRSSSPGGEREADARADSDSLAAITVLDPNFEVIFNPSWSMPARFLVFSPLVGLDETGGIEPRLARSWEHSEDYREWTFHLRTDVRWHDGERFDAHDVAFTERLMADPEVGYRSPNRDTVIAVDDSTVTIRETEPWDGRDTWWVYYPEHLLAGVEPSELFGSEFWTRPVGTGPFRYVRHVPKTVVVLEANPDYFRGAPGIGRVRIKFGGGKPLVELRAGNVDAATYVSRAEIPLLREDPGLRVYHHVYPYLSSLEALLWSSDHPFLGEAGVRRALTLAMDREELHRLLYVPEGFPVTDVLPSRRQFWEGEIPPPLPHDPERARSLLDSLGWRDVDGDGLRTRGAAEARFAALVQGGQNTMASGKAAVYVQAALRDVGVRMEIRALESGFTDRVRGREFEAAFGMVSRTGRDFFLRDEATPYRGEYPALGRIYAALDTVFDPAIRDSLYRESWPIFRRDLPVTLLAPQFQTFAAHRRVRGLESPFRAHPYIAAEQLWLQEEP